MKRVVIIELDELDIDKLFSIEIGDISDEIRHMKICDIVHIFNVFLNRVGDSSNVTLLTSNLELNLKYKRQINSINIRLIVDILNSRWAIGIEEFVINAKRIFEKK